MAGQRWTEACNALNFIADEALQYDVDGIGLLFLNSQLHAENLKVGISNYSIDLFRRADGLRAGPG